MGGGADPQNVIVGGCSAGGGLAVALLLKIKAEGKGDIMPRASIPLSPWVDLTQSGSSYNDNHGKCKYITKGYLDWASRQYLNGGDPKHPLASPLFADLSQLPPMLIIAGGNETLLDDSTALAARVAAAGGEVCCEIYPGVSHGFMLGDGDGGTLAMDGSGLNPARRAALRQVQYILEITGCPQLTTVPWHHAPSL